MAYFPDLSPYVYERSELGMTLLNVGWLDNLHKFSTGPVSAELQNRVLHLCRVPVRRTRGYHCCALCERANVGVRVDADGRSVVLGSAEIRVLGREGKVYASPDLIYHYLRDHGYLPPEEFVEALRLYAP